MDIVVLVGEMVAEKEANWCLRYVVAGYCCIGWVDGGREGSNWCLGMWLLDIVVLVG